jgi:myo-inositol-1(or 4)-monophosphatase
MKAIREKDFVRFTEEAIELATSGAELARTMMGSTRSHLKADHSPVTDADMRVQDMIVRRLRRDFPSHGILAEESSGLLGTDELQREFVWAIDPIDGTRNFAAGIPIFTCSVGLLHAGMPVAGAVVMPEPRMIFSASASGPTLLNGKPISVPKQPLSQTMVIALSASQYGSTPPYLQRWPGRRILRDFGSLAYHLALLSAGMIDAVVNLNGKLWDIAAGALLVQQAGGRVIKLDDTGKPTDEALLPLDLSHYTRTSVCLVACSPVVGDELVNDMCR